MIVDDPYDHLHGNCNSCGKDHDHTTVLIKNGNQSRVTAKNMTERQYKALSWHLWRYGAKWKPATVDELKKLDNITASDIIQLFDNGMIDSAICQLKHLDIEV